MPATTAEGQARQPNADPLPLAWRFWVVTLLVGVGAGLAGGLLTLLLHAVQDVAFGYRAESFQLGVERAPAWRRVVVPALAGLVAGLGWWWLRGPVSRRLGPARGVSGAVWDPHGRMGLTRTFLDGVLQIVIVAMGASLGRERAPREVSAALASRLAEPTGLSAGERRVLIACGAGAGLAAVYDVPFGGGLFTPTLATGALLGAVLGHLRTLVWVGGPPGAYALVGAAAFLAAAQQAPLSAVVLVLELTHVGTGLLVPIALAAVLAALVARLVEPRSTATAGLEDPVDAPAPSSG